MKKLLIVLLALMFCLVSCSKPEQTQTTAQTATQTTTASTASTTSTTSTASTASNAIETPAVAAQSAPAELAPASLKVWYSISGTNGQFFESQVRAFMEQNPQISIELTYTASLAAEILVALSE